MSLAELKQEIERLPAAEKSYLAACLNHLTRRHEAGYATALDSTWQRMEEDEKVSLEEALRLGKDPGKSGAQVVDFTPFGFDTPFCWPAERLGCRSGERPRADASRLAGARRHEGRNVASLHGSGLLKRPGAVRFP